MLSFVQVNELMTNEICKTKSNICFRLEPVK